MLRFMSSRDCWPTADQLLLLQAAALGPERAAASFREWLARNDVRHLDESSTRLLPAVDFNLQRHGIDNPHARLMAGLRRHALCRTHWTLHTSAKVVRVLSEHGIPCLVLKGAAMSRLYAPSPSVRPMNDLDLLVPRRHARAAMTTLVEAGFRPHAPNPSELIFVRHSTPFSRGPVEIDLHWDVLPESHRLDDAWAFDGARPLDLAGVASSALAPTAQLFHGIAHGLRHSHTPAAWWPLDALFVLRESSAIDFERLVQLSVDHRLSSALYQGLAYLSKHLEVELPSGLLTRLRAVPQSLSVRLESSLRMKRCEPLGELPLQLLHYRRLTAELPLRSRIHGLPLYLTRTWQLDAGTSLAAALSTKAANRIRAWLASRGSGGVIREPRVDTLHR